jgi:hypothetical protein
MVVKATEFETLRVLHSLWVSRDLDPAKVKRILRESYGLELTVLANGEISAESEDGKQKYKINQ